MRDSTAHREASYVLFRSWALGVCEDVGVRICMSIQRPHMVLLHRTVMMERVFLRDGIKVLQG
jgi:hypothetical protein